VIVLFWTRVVQDLIRRRSTLRLRDKVLAIMLILIAVGVFVSALQGPIPGAHR
jgi:hypothetical protein